MKALELRGVEKSFKKRRGEVVRALDSVSLSVAIANSKSLRATLALREGFPGDRAYLLRSAILSARSCSRAARSCANT